jgi:hypothetical protein
MQNETYKGFELFMDIDDVNLRNRNRAVVLANLADDNRGPERTISPKGAALMLGYFQEIPEADRADVMDRFKIQMMDRGYVLATRT